MAHQRSATAASRHKDPAPLGGDPPMPGKEEASFGFEAYTDNRTPHSIAGMLPAPHASNWRNVKSTSTSRRVLSFHYKFFWLKVIFRRRSNGSIFRAVRTHLSTVGAQECAQSVNSRFPAPYGCIETWLWTHRAAQVVSTLTWVAFEYSGCSKVCSKCKITLWGPFWGHSDLVKDWCCSLTRSWTYYL